MSPRHKPNAKRGYILPIKKIYTQA